MHFTTCCNYKKLLFEDGTEWEFCGMCLEEAEYYEADEPREEHKTASDMHGFNFDPSK
tara:strand:- start:1538 stop:1711 length:174 start_codon:yes stop_codon:yes gene_type:complete